jgi:poly(3-hydroxybutyrate) depolymerase
VSLPGLAAAEGTVKEIPLREGLAIAVAGRAGRSPIHTDPIEALLVAGTWRAPKRGDTVTLPDGTTRTWEAVKAGGDGLLNLPGRGASYVFFAVPSESDRVLLLEASGHSLAYVNGEPRAGDPYGHRYVRLPVALRKGSNDLLLVRGRGPLRARLVPPKAPVYLDFADSTMPDLLVGEPVQTWAGMLLVNATTAPLDDLTIEATAGGGPVRTAVPPLPPLSLRKILILLKGPASTEVKDREIAVRLLRAGQDSPLDTARLTLRVRRPEESHKRTFLSDIDGSVQYYAVQPARPLPGNTAPPALFLTLHGAGVEATGQADAYSPKTWGHLVAATNRRPFGFDWEDWGRLDALEVLQNAQRTLRTDPRRTYLTGHSMGGHGAWHLGVTFPDRFAAIGPSAGWISMWSYAGAVRPDRTSAVEELLLRTMSPSDTLALARNTAQHGVYILHGGADDNVPAGQARQMKSVLGEFHRDFLYHEQPGAGHWWDASDEAGTDCVDWAPMFDFFARRVLPPREAVRQVDFTTASPGVSAWCHWAGIEAQLKFFKPSTVSLRYDPWQRRFRGTTDNVARLALDLGHVRPGEPITVELDGQKLEKIAWPAKATRVWLKREQGKWSVMAGEPPRALKGPHRYGPFKDAFRNRMVLVYGTHGNAAENAWALARARYDAETFWYRGNGSVDVLPDTALDPAAQPERNIILYGNADTNGAWKALLGEGPVQVRRGVVRVGDREEKGDDLAGLFVRPRPGSDRATVAAVSGTGLPGMRLTERLPYFVSGIAYPDCLILGTESLTRGMEGVRAAGFFGMDWGVASGEFAWRK